MSETTDKTHDMIADAAEEEPKDIDTYEEDDEDEAEEENDADLQKFANKKNAVLIAFIGSYVPRRYGPTAYGRANMSTIDEFGVERVLTSILRMYPDKRPKLYLLVNSLGGSLTSSFKIALAIRRCFDDITVFVPHAAVSGGTMLALTGNRIRMGMMSNLGPVDVQVPYKKTSISTNSLLTAETELAERVAKKRPDELSYVERHLVKSLDPAIQIEMANARKMVAQYMEMILKEVGYEEATLRKIIKTLTIGLPTHEFVIQSDLAREMGIKVEASSENTDEWETMRWWFWKYIAKATSTHFVKYVVPKEETSD